MSESLADNIKRISKMIYTDSLIYKPYPWVLSKEQWKRLEKYIDNLKENRGDSKWANKKTYGF